MATLETIATQVVAAIGGDIGYPLVAEWVRARYQQLATRVKLKHLRQLGQVNIAAPVTVVDITAVRGGDTLASITAGVEPSLLGKQSNGWFVRVSTVWYEVVDYGFTVAGTIYIKLKQPFAEESVTGGTCTLIQRYVKLDASAVQTGTSWVHARRRRPVTRTTMEKLNTIAAFRPLINSGGPEWVADGPEIEGRRTVETYPYSTTSEALFYVYWKDVPSISITEELPSSVKEYAMKEGALIDCYRYLMNQYLKKSLVDVAGFYRNEMRAQETKWDDYLMELIQADQGEDDGQFILRMLGNAPAIGDIRTARDLVWGRS